MNRPRKATLSGGAVLESPRAFGDGKFAILADPTGPVLGAFEGDVDD